jgi:hypothetical protein
MKVKKELLESVDADSPLGQVICCALYLNSKIKKDNVSGTIHEQVALLRIKEKDNGAIARKTGFEKTTVQGALRDIANFCGARE